MANEFLQKRNLASTPLTAEELAAIRQKIRNGFGDDHTPAQTDRLFSDSPGVAIDHANRRLVLPRGGAWEASGHTNPNRVNAPQQLQHLLDPEVPNADYDSLPPPETERWKDAGYWIDDRGLPVPTASVQMLEDSAIGVATGLGQFWYRGVNKTVDLAVVRWPLQLLLVRRRRGEKMAFAGGFVDPGEQDEDAAAREVYEETGLAELGNPRNYELIDSRLLIGMGATAHAMPGNMFFLAHGIDNDHLHDAPLSPDPKETLGAGWYTMSQIEEFRQNNDIFEHHLGHLAILAARLGLR